MDDFISVHTEIMGMPLFPEHKFTNIQRDVNREADLFQSTAGGSTEYEYLHLVASFAGIFKPVFALETGTLGGVGTLAIASSLHSGSELLTIDDEAIPEDSTTRLSEVAQARGITLRHLTANTNNITEQDWHRETKGLCTFAFLDSSIPDRPKEFEVITRPGNPVMNLRRPCCVMVHDMSRHRHPQDSHSEYLAGSVGSLMQTAQTRGWSFLRLNQSRGMVVMTKYPDQ